MILALWDCCSLVWLAVGMLCMLIGVVVIVGAVCNKDLSPADRKGLGGGGVLATIVGAVLVAAWVLIKMVK